MRILLASFWYFPHVGGVWSYVCQLKESLEKQGHHVDILAQGHGEIYHIVNKGFVLEHGKVKGVVSPNVYHFYEQHFPRVEPWMKKFETDRYCFELAAAYFDLSQYDLIHTQDVISTHAISRVKPKRIPLVATIHGCLTREYSLGGLDKKKNPFYWDYHATLEYYGVTSSDTVTIVPTHWLKNIFINDFGVPAEKMTVIPYGMDVNAFLRKLNGPTDVVAATDKKMIVCPARLYHVKGHHTLLHALAKLKRKRSDWVCYLLGDGPLHNKLRQQCKQLNLEEHVVFLGDRQDVPAILKRAHIFVLPSILDNQPFAVMEAEIAGKAIVVSDAGGIPEMVSHEQTGLVSTAGQPDAMAENLERLLRDDSLRSRLALQAKQWGVKYWDINRAIKQTTAIYESALK